MKPSEKGFSLQSEGFIESHPFVLLTIACMLVLSLFTNGAKHGMSVERIYVLFALTVAASIFALRKQKYRLFIQQNYIFVVLIVLFIALVFVLFLNSTQPLLFIFVAEILFLAGLLFYFKRKGTLTTKKILFLIAAASFLLRVLYILYTPYNVRQHDVFDIGSDQGHIAYIEYLLNHNFALPNFDPRAVFQFYQPPLHYLIAAICVKFNTLLGMDYTQAVESIQVLTLFYSGCITILCYKLLKEFHLQKTALIIPFAILCFHPSLIILSGSINNDALCFTLMLAAVLAAVRWYKNPDSKKILLIAVFLGFAMNTKASAGLMAPAVAVLFLAKLFQAKGYRRRIITQLLAFGLICIPIGLWWIVKNNLQYGMPLTYVPKLSLNSSQYIGDYSWYQRFFDFDPLKFKSIFINWDKPFRDFNIWITTLKSSVFDEYATDTLNVIPAKLLFYSNLVLVLLSAVCGIMFLYKKQRNADIAIKAFICTLFAGIFGSYLQFCLEFPHICTMSFRYIEMTLVTGVLGIGFVLNGLQQKQSNFPIIFVRVSQAAAFLFCFCSVVFFTVMGIST